MVPRIRKGHLLSPRITGNYGVNFLSIVSRILKILPVAYLFPYVGALVLLLTTDVLGRTDDFLHGTFRGLSGRLKQSCRVL